MPDNNRKHTALRNGDLVPDNRLTSVSDDLLEHDAIAKGVAEIALQAEAPVNIALFGAWGSGKSSVYSMIEQHLDQVAPGKVRMARYDAWKYGGRELKRNFVDSIARALNLENHPDFSEGLDTEQVDVRFDLWLWLKNNKRSILLGIGLATAIGILWVLAQAVGIILLTENGFIDSIRSLAMQSGTVFGLALIAVLVGPKVLEGAVFTRRMPPPEGSDQFAKRFRKLVKTALKRKGERLVIFIDELDRCDPKDVVSTLVDLKTFLDQDDCAFIVAADREVIERALEDVPQAKPIRQDEPYYSTPGAFLDKIFQHQIALPPLRSRALTKFAHDLVDHQQGVWQELRDHGQSTFDLTVFALIPVHVRSPRRVKVLLNNFATNARIAASRGLPWLERAHEIAVLTVLQTEFPAVAEDLRRVPKLLEYLRDEESSSSTYIQQVVSRYRPSPPQHDSETTSTQSPEQRESVSGRLLVDDESASELRVANSANEKLQSQLITYLSKVKAAEIRDPRPELFYLQSVAGRSALPDPLLGDVIDFATDTAPSTVVSAFDDHESATLAIAIPLLVTEGDNAPSPGREFAYEAACRLAERLGPDDRVEVASQVAPSLIASANSRKMPPASMPGAMLVAQWTGATQVVHEISQRLIHIELDQELLLSLVATLEHLARDQRELVIQLLAENFDERPNPFITALREAPINLATEIWLKGHDPVVTTLFAEDQSGPENASGIRRLEEVVSAVQNRSDHEPLLSDILVEFQTQDAPSLFSDWVSASAEHLIATMSSPLRRARHAVRGLSQYPQCDVRTWIAVLPEYDTDASPGSTNFDTDPRTSGYESTGSAIGPEATLRGEVSDDADELLKRLVDAFETTGSDDLQELQKLIGRVSRWASNSAKTLASALSTTLENIGWANASNENEAGHLLWKRKEALVEATLQLKTQNDSIISSEVHHDLSQAIGEVELTDFFTSRWLAIALQLPVTDIRQLAAHLESYEPTESEKATSLQLRLALRRATGDSAVSSAEILSVPREMQSTALAEAWIELNPDLDEVLNVFDTVPFSPQSLGNYSANLNVRQRTDLWLDLLSRAPDPHLAAIGSHGVASDAVSRIRAEVANATREHDRAYAVGQLLLATPDLSQSTAIRKVASELAHEILEKKTSGDLKTAANLISWAGGVARGHVQTLRREFNDLAGRHEKTLSRETIQKLSAANLVTAPKKKGFFASLKGR